MDHQHTTWAWNTSIWTCTHASDRHVQRQTPQGSVCAVLPSDCSSSLFTQSFFPPTFYLLCHVYLTHSSQRGNKLALNNNLTDNYSKANPQWNELDNTGYLSTASPSAFVPLLYQYFHFVTITSLLCYELN